MTATLGTSRQNLVRCWPTCPRFGPTSMSVDFGPNSGQIRPKSAKFGRASTKAWPMSTEIRPIGTKVEQSWPTLPMLVKQRQDVTHVGRSRTQVGQISANFGRTWPSLGCTSIRPVPRLLLSNPPGWCLPDFACVCPNLAGLRPNLGALRPKLGAVRATQEFLRQSWGPCDQTWAVCVFGQTWAGFGQSWAVFDQIWGVFDQFGANRDQVCCELNQLLAGIGVQLKL